jgi:iduronate 2-sulfatase
LPENPGLPQNAPAYANQSGGEWRTYHNVAEADKMPDSLTQKEYIRAYMASVSFVDAQVGKLISALNELGLEKNTLVVLFSDHGYHLFDHASFGKSTNFENATRVPLIIRKPGGANVTKKSHAIVELIDIYPTVCELTGLPKPEHLQGESIAQVITGNSDQGKIAAHSQYKRGGNQGNSVRTSRYRYTEWIDKNGKIADVELYDYLKDKNETINIAYEDTNAKIISELSEILHQVY